MNIAELGEHLAVTYRDSASISRIIDQVLGPQSVYARTEGAPADVWHGILSKNINTDALMISLLEVVGSEYPANTVFKRSKEFLRSNADSTTRSEGASWARGGVTDRRVVPQAHFLLETSRRRRFLQQEALGFLTPGRDHPADPDRLMRQLGDAENGRGVLLVGVAGLGKSRTCHEVAERADAAGWQVLHVLANPSTTTSDIKYELAAVTRPALLIVDYLDVCSGLDLHELSTWISNRAGAGSVKLLATARPATYAQPAVRRAAPILIERQLRDDADFRQQLAAHIVSQVAPRAVERWGDASVRKICGDRPGIAVLIARELEVGLLSGSYNREPTPFDLVEWLHVRLLRDGLLSTDLGEPFTSTTPNPSVIAAALAVASCPAERHQLDAVVDHAAGLGAAGGRPEVAGRDIVQTLLGMGWLTSHDGWVETVHDLVSDELLRTALVREHQMVDAELFDQMVEAVVPPNRPLDSFARATSRVYAEASRAVKDHWDDVCSQSVDKRAAQIGQRFVREAASAHTLSSLLNSEPWQSPMLRNWSVVVGPWMEAMTGAQDGSLLASVLSGLPHGHGAPVALTAFVWVAGNADDPETPEVLRLLLSRRDLPPEQRRGVRSKAVDWVQANPQHEALPAVLVALVRGLPRALNSSVRAIHEVVYAVVEEEQVRYDVDRVIQALLVQGQSGQERARARAAARSWLRLHGLTERARWLLHALLRVQMPSEDRAWALRAASAWLARNGTNSSASVVLQQAILASRTDAQVTTARDYAITWLKTFQPPPLSASYVLTSLLMVTPPGRDDFEYISRTARQWLDVYVHTKAAGFVLPRLLEVSLLDESWAVPPWVLEYSLAHCESQHGGAASWTLRHLLNLDHTAMTPEAKERLRTAVLRWLADNDRDVAVPHVLGPALTWAPFGDVARTVLVDLAVRWLTENFADTVGSAVILASLTSLAEDPSSGDELRERVREAADKLLEHRPQGPERAFVLARMAHAGLVAGSLTDQTVIREVQTGLLGFLDAPHLPDVLVNLLAVTPNRTASDLDLELRRTVRRAASQWLHSHEDFPEVPDVVAALSTGNGGDLSAMHAIVATTRRWLHRYPGHPKATRVVRRCLAVAPAMPADLRNSMVQAILDWRSTDDRGYLDSAILLSMVRLSMEADRRSDLVAAIFAWTDAHPGSPATSKLLAAIVAHPGGKDLSSVQQPYVNESTHLLYSVMTVSAPGPRSDILGDTIGWLRSHPTDRAWLPLTLAVLRGSVTREDQRRDIEDICIAHVDGQSDDDGATTLLCALGAVKWMALARRRDIHGRLLDRLRSDPDHLRATYIYQALANGKPAPEQQAEAMVRLAAWWDRHEGEAWASYALTTTLASGIPDNAEAAAPLVRRAIDAAKADMDGPRAAPLLNASLDAYYVHAGLLTEVIDLVLENPTAILHGSPGARVLATVQRTADLLDHRSREVEELTLDWLDGHPMVPETSRVLQRVAESHTLTEARRGQLVDICLRWIDRRPDDHEANYILQAALAAAPSQDLPRVVDEAVQWIASHPDHAGTPHVVGRLGQAISRDARPQAADVVLGWVDGNLDRDELGIAIRRLIPATKTHPATHALIVERTLRWLDSRRRDDEANFVLQELLKSPPEDEGQVRVIESMTLDWLDSCQSSNAYPFMLRTALESKCVSVETGSVLTESALTWLRVRGDARSADNAALGVLGRARLTTFDQRLREESARVIFDWLATEPSTETWVLRASLRSALFDDEQRDHLFARALDLLESDVAVPNRGDFWGKLINAATLTNRPSTPKLVERLSRDERLAPRDLQHAIPPAVAVPNLPTGTVTRFVDRLERELGHIRLRTSLRPLVTSTSATDSDVERLLRIVVGLLPSLGTREAVRMLLVFGPQVTVAPETATGIDVWVRETLIPSHSPEIKRLARWELLPAGTRRSVEAEVARTYPSPAASAGSRRGKPNADKPLATVRSVFARLSARVRTRRRQSGPG